MTVGGGYVHREQPRPRRTGAKQSVGGGDVEGVPCRSLPLQSDPVEGIAFSRT